MPLVRSEVGEDASNFNSLPRWAKGKVHFPPLGAYQAKCQSAGRDAVSVRRASQSIANRSGPLGAHIL